MYKNLRELAARLQSQPSGKTVPSSQPAK